MSASLTYEDDGEAVVRIPFYTRWLHAFCSLFSAGVRMATPLELSQRRELDMANEEIRTLRRERDEARDKAVVLEQHVAYNAIQWAAIRAEKTFEASLWHLKQQASTSPQSGGISQQG